MGARSGLAIAAMFCLFAAASPAEAFKVSTHVLVAQKVLDDVLPDGSITLTTNDGRTVTIPVPRPTYVALLENAASYRAGSIGPDALPGIYEGQMIIHPGACGWGTSEWLLHAAKAASRSEEIAFTMGMMAHAAGDVFAHSYVNRYAGNTWQTTKEGTEAERRHFLLEGYVEKLQPPLADAARKSVSVIQGDDLLGAPKAFLTETFFLDRAATGKLMQCAPHYELLRLELEALQGLIRNDDGLLWKIEYAIKQYFAKKYLGRPLSDDELETLRKISTASLQAVDKVDKTVHGAIRTALKLGVQADQAANEQKYRLLKEAAEAADQALKAEQAAERELAGLAHREARERSKMLKNIKCEAIADVPPLAAESFDFQSALGAISSGSFEAGLSASISPAAIASGKIDDVFDDAKSAAKGAKRVYEKAEKARKRAEASLRDPPRDITRPSRFSGHIEGAVRLFQKSQRWQCEQVKRAVGNNPAWPGLSEELGKAHRKASRARTERISAVSTFESVRQATQKAEETPAVLADAFARLDRRFLELTSITHHDNVSISLVENWIQNIKDALSAYYQANAQIVLPVARRRGEKGWQIIERWMKCELPKIQGLGEVSKTQCTFDDIRAQLDVHFEQLAIAMAGIPEAKDLLTELSQARERLKGDAFEKVTDEILKRLNQEEYRKLLNVLDENPDAKALKTEFSHSAHNYLVIPDIVARVSQDMELARGKPFNPGNFAAFANAVTLSKLALLDSAGLNGLIDFLCRKADESECGMNPAPYKDGIGGNLYPPGWAVLTLAARSIDGDHQWRDTPPNYPRASGPGVEPGSATYDVQSEPSAGFRLWVNRQARNEVFRQLFKGPLTPALDAPKAPLKEILPAEYRTRACPADPFPDEYQESCK